MEVLAATVKNYLYLKEGSTQILNEGCVFYNPVQEFNRDLSITVLSTFSKIFLTEQNEKRDNVKRKQNAEEKLTEESKTVSSDESEPITVKAGEKLEVSV